MTFYAFGLDDKKLGDAKYAFEVWGTRLDQPTSAKSLGMLNNDDQHQKTWVLKVSDPRQLAGIDSRPKNPLRLPGRASQPSLGIERSGHGAGFSHRISGTSSRGLRALGLGPTSWDGR
jgi:hypothetical protein